MFLDQFPVGTKWNCSVCQAEVLSEEGYAYTLPRRSILVETPGKPNDYIHITYPASRYWTEDLKHVFCGSECAFKYFEENQWTTGKAK